MRGSSVIRVLAMMLISVIASVAGGSCRSHIDAPAPGGLTLSPAESIEYSLSWSWSGATWNAARRSYVFKTDLGYTIRLEAGYVGTASVELVPCRLGQQTPAKLGFLELIPSALASHGYVHDTSLVENPTVESILRTDPSTFGAGKSSGKSYCQLHELLAPLDQKAADGFHLDHWSAFIRGGYTLPSGGEEHPFEAHVNLRGGALVELKRAAGDTGSGAVRVRVTRSALHSFDGVAMEKLTASELAYAFLRGLTKGTTAEYSFASR